MKLVLSMDSLNTIRLRVDASYVSHSDCKGHTGMMIPLGKGAAMYMSCWQKLNTKRSRESDLFGIDDALPQIPWGDILLRHKDTLWSTTPFSKAISQPSCWWQMEKKIWFQENQAHQESFPSYQRQYQEG